MQGRAININEQQLYNQVISSIESDLGEVLNPGDERRIVAGNILAAIVAAINQSNAYAKAQCLRYSYGDQLDNLGEFVNAYRLPATSAAVAVRFTASAPSGVVITIPEGTRVTADGKQFFALSQTLLLSWDADHIDGIAYAVESGKSYSGYPVGTITTIVDQVQYLTGVTNTTPSVGGADAEDDDSFRDRILNAPGGFSVAGPVKAYKYFALSADARVGDVSVVSPAPTQVVVTVLQKGGLIPDEELLSKVQETLSADDVRPITDHVQVKAAVAHEYTVAAEYYISAQDATDEVQIKERVSSAYAEYLAEQRGGLGRAINPDSLRKKVLGAGACRLDITTPIYTAVDPDKVAIASAGSSLLYKGLL